MEGLKKYAVAVELFHSCQNTVPVFNSNEHFEIVTNGVRSSAMYELYYSLQMHPNKKFKG